MKTILRSAVGPAESGHAQSSVMGTRQRGTTPAPIIGVSRHWQGPSDSDSEHTEPALADADGVVRAREVQKPKAGPDHERGRRGTRRSAAHKRRKSATQKTAGSNGGLPRGDPEGAARACSRGGKGAREHQCGADAGARAKARGRGRRGKGLVRRKARAQRRPRQCSDQVDRVGSAT